MIAPNDTGEPLAPLFKLYEQRMLRGASQSAIRRYQNALRSLDKFLGRPATIADLTDDTILDAMYGLQKERQWSPYTANKFRACMLAFWRFLARKRIAAEFPDVPRMIEPKRIPQAWNQDQLVMLWAACDAQQGFIDDVPARLWWHALHAIIWDSAERIGAVMGLRWDDVDLRSRIVVFRAECRKGGRSDSAVKIHPDTAAALERIKGDREHVFPWPYVEVYLWVKYKRLLQSAGLPTDRKSKFHRLRKSSASWFAAAGGNATDLLRHSSPTLAKESYLDPRITHADDKQASDVLFRISEPLDVDGNTVSPVVEDDWTFGAKGFAYRGQSYRLGSAMTHTLRIIVKAGRPVSAQDVAEHFVVRHSRAGQRVRDLRRALQRLFGNDEWDPIPRVSNRGHDSYYALNFPPPVGRDNRTGGDA